MKNGLTNIRSLIGESREILTKEVDTISRLNEEHPGITYRLMLNNELEGLEKYIQQVEDQPLDINTLVDINSSVYNILEKLGKKNITPSILEKVSEGICFNGECTSKESTDLLYKINVYNKELFEKSLDKFSKSATKLEDTLNLYSFFSFKSINKIISDMYTNISCKVNGVFTTPPEPDSSFFNKLLFNRNNFHMRETQILMEDLSEKFTKVYVSFINRLKLAELQLMVSTQTMLDEGTVAKALDIQSLQPELRQVVERKYANLEIPNFEFTYMKIPEDVLILSTEKLNQDTEKILNLQMDLLDATWDRVKKLLITHYSLLERFTSCYIQIFTKTTRDDIDEELQKCYESYEISMLVEESEITNEFVGEIEKQTVRAFIVSNDVLSRIVASISFKYQPRKTLDIFIKCLERQIEFLEEKHKEYQLVVKKFVTDNVSIRNLRNFYTEKRDVLVKRIREEKDPNVLLQDVINFKDSHTEFVNKLEGKDSIPLLHIKANNLVLEKVIKNFKNQTRSSLLSLVKNLNDNVYEYQRVSEEYPAANLTFIESEITKRYNLKEQTQQFATIIFNNNVKSENAVPPIVEFTTPILNLRLVNNGIKSKFCQINNVDELIIEKNSALLEKELNYKKYERDLETITKALDVDRESLVKLEQIYNLRFSQEALRELNSSLIKNPFTVINTREKLDEKYFPVLQFTSSKCFEQKLFGRLECLRKFIVDSILESYRNDILEYKTQFSYGDDDYLQRLESKKLQLSLIKEKISILESRRSRFHILEIKKNIDRSILSDLLESTNLLKNDYSEFLKKNLSKSNEIESYIRTKDEIKCLQHFLELYDEMKTFTKKGVYRKLIDEEKVKIYKQLQSYEQVYSSWELDNILLLRDHCFNLARKHLISAQGV